MEFDKSKILTVVTADQAKVGMRGWFANDIYSLKIYIERGDEPKGLQSVDFHNEYPFRESYPSDGSFACKYRYFYPVPEPTYAERQAQWVKENNVKKGTKVRFIKGFDDSEDGSECCEHKDAKGKEGIVVNITKTYIYVSLGKLGWTAPFTTLEVIKESTYAERQAEWVKEHNLQVGTKVRITRDFGRDEEAGTTGHSGVAGMTGKVWGMGPHYIDVVCNQDRIVRTTPYYALEAIKGPTYRPFNNNELNDLVGRVVIQKHTGNAMLVIKVVDGETWKMVSLGGSQKRNAQQLLEGWTFKDGNPCGVKEEA